MDKIQEEIIEEFSVFDDWLDKQTRTKVRSPAACRFAARSQPSTAPNST